MSEDSEAQGHNGQQAADNGFDISVGEPPEVWAARWSLAPEEQMFEGKIGPRAQAYEFWRPNNFPIRGDGALIAEEQELDMFAFRYAARDLLSTPNGRVADLLIAQSNDLDPEQYLLMYSMRNRAPDITNKPSEAVFTFTLPIASYPSFMKGVDTKRLRAFFGLSEVGKRCYAGGSTGFSPADPDRLLVVIGGQDIVKMYGRSTTETDVPGYVVRPYLAKRSCRPK